MELTGLKDTLLEATLPNVLFDGWTDHALRTGAHALGLGPEMVLHAFPDGPVDAAAWFSSWADRKMVESYQAADTGALGMTARIALAVRLRLEALAGHKEAVQSWMAWLALPPHGGLAIRLLYQTIDEIWHTVGDSSTDFSFYTKRALLAGVYSTTVLYWLGDDSENHGATWDFLDRALKASTGFGRSVAKAGGVGKALNLIPSPVRFARQIRRRAAGRG